MELSLANRHADDPKDKDPVVVTIDNNCKGCYYESCDVACPEPLVCFSEDRPDNQYVIYIQRK